MFVLSGRLRSRSGVAADVSKCRYRVVQRDKTPTPRLLGVQPKEVRIQYGAKYTACIQLQGYCKVSHVVRVATMPHVPATRSEECTESPQEANEVTYSLLVLRWGPAGAARARTMMGQVDRTRDATTYVRDAPGDV